jgi:N-acetylglucosaminyl-diphospho-decaprenol L-rhamnosyltransferase
MAVLKSGRVSIVLASWNLRAHLRECLTAVERESGVRPVEITVVDNGSTDGTAEMVAREFPRAILIRNETNLGFVRATNAGLRRALEDGRSDYLLLLNADVVVRDGAVDRLAEYLDTHPEVVAVAPLLLLPDGRPQPGPAGFNPTLGSALSYFFLAGKILPFAARPLFIDPEAVGARIGRTRAVGVEWLSGACLLVRAETVRRVGLMNEEYYLYADDIEWGVRMSAAGGVLHFLPAVRVTHHHGVTVKAVDRGFNTRWLDQLFAHVRRDRGAGEAVLFRIVAAAGFGLRAFLYALQALRPARSASAGLKVREMLAYASFSFYLIYPRERSRFSRSLS